MPLTAKGRKVKAAMMKQYGKKKGEQVFYASENKNKKKKSKKTFAGQLAKSMKILKGY